MQNLDPHHKTTSHRSWLERLSQALLREPKDREQLVELLRDAEQRDLLDAQALAMIEGVLQFSEMQVSDIMVPRTQMISVSQTEPLATFLPLIIESEHSRFPVLGEDRNEVVGILLAKDLLRYALHQPNLPFNIHDVIRPAIFVPESKRLNILLQEFRINHNHMAIVVDEYGGVAGLVTIEDVLEQIVGDIADEYDNDDDEEFIKKYSETQYIVKALTPIEDFNEYFNAKLSDTEFDTIGGIVMQAFGHLPKRGETVVIEPFRFKVINADNRRIRLLRITKRPQTNKTHADF
jgi:magnesium and cobalt transporter